MTRRGLTVRADGIIKLFGTADPQLTFRIGGAGIVNGDRLSGALLRESGELVGTYRILHGSLNNINYAITFVPGTFAIGQPHLPAAVIPSVYKRALGPLPLSVAMTSLSDTTLLTHVPDVPTTLCDIASQGVCLFSGS